MFVIVRSDTFGNFNDFYCGNTYVYQGEKFAVCDTDPHKAKAYTTHQRAKNAAERLSEKTGNLWKVVSLDTDA